MRCQRLHRLLCGQQAPTDWTVAWIRKPSRNVLAVAAVVYAVQGLSVSPDIPGWAIPTLFALSSVFCLVTAAILTRRLPGKVALGFAVGCLAFLTLTSNIFALFSSDRVFRERTLARNEIIFKAAPTILGYPLMVSAALIIVSLVNDVASMEMMKYYFGNPSTVRMHLVSACSALFWLGLAVLTSGRLCSIFDAQRALATERELLSSMIAMMCDATVWLSEDGQTVLGSDHRFKVILGRDVTGEDVCNSLAEKERQQLQQTLPRAKAAPFLLPTTLVTESGLHIPVDMFIVGNRDTHAGGRAGELPAYLIGVRVGEYHASTSSSAPAPPVARQRPADPGPLALEDGQSIADAAFSSVASVPDTTPSGCIFESIRASVENTPSEMQRNLQNVMTLGEKEHWLLNPADLQINANEVLGSGSFGVVVPGWFHGSPVAVKATKDVDDRAGTQHLVAIANEIRILRRVRHPNVVLFHGACVVPEEGELVLVLERIQGPTLCQYVECHAADSEACKRFQLLLDVACALRFLHALQPQVIHGDLKGTNVVVESALPRAKLLDFGISRTLTKKARPLGGSLAWMAPEIICKRAGAPSPSADVFSFGRITCMITTGKKPLAGLHHQAIVSMARRGVTQLNLWEEGRPLHSEGRELCTRLLSYAPEQRPSAAQAHAEISAWPPPLAGEEMPALELARAVVTGGDNLSSLRRALRPGAVNDQARRWPLAGRAGRGAALESVDEHGGERGAAGRAAPHAERLSL